MEHMEQMESGTAADGQAETAVDSVQMAAAPERAGDSRVPVSTQQGGGDEGTVREKKAGEEAAIGMEKRERPHGLDLMTLNMLTNAAESGSSSAQYALACIFFEGDGVERDLHVAKKWARAAFGNGDPQACSLLYEIYMAERMERLLQRAEAGVPDAMYALAQLLEDRDGEDAADGEQEQEQEQEEEEDREEWEEELAAAGETALSLYEKAARKGHVAAQSRLGVLYSDSPDGKDDAKALYWLRRAAAGKDATALRYLGERYLRGEGLEQSDAEAFHCFQKAAAGGDVTARFQGALLYYQGRGVPRSLKKARKWAEMAAAKGSQEAADLLEEIRRES